MLSELFKTKERVNILQEVFLRNEISVTEISNDTKIQGIGIKISKRNGKGRFNLRKGVKYYNRNTPLVKAIKVMLNLNILKWEKISPPWAQSAVLYGSWTSSTNTDESNIDIWIKSSKMGS